MAIKGLKTLIDEGKLSERDKDGEVKKTGRSLDLEEEKKGNKTKVGELRRLLDERIGIEIIPAVLKGETKEAALQRLRSIFMDIKAMPKN